MAASKAAVQMYTLRDFTKTAADFARTLDRVAEIGYRAVQLSAVGCMNGETPEVSAEKARTMLDERGIVCCATHRGWDPIEKDTAREIAFHQALGCPYIGIGGIPGPYREKGAAGFSAFVKDSAPTLAKLSAAGLTFVYHNHAFEFTPVPGGGTWYDVFIKDGGRDFGLEIDTYWAIHAGVNPVTLIQRCAGRVPVMHFKDKTMVGNDTQFAPVGEGNLEWDAIIAACNRAGSKWFCVEQDNCYGRDPFDCIASSYRFLRAKNA